MASPHGGRPAKHPPRLGGNRLRYSTALTPVPVHHPPADRPKGPCEKGFDHASAAAAAPAASSASAGRAAPAAAQQRPLTPRSMPP